VSLTQDQITNGNLESWQFGWSGDQLQQITNTWGDGYFDVDRFSYTPDGELQRMTRDDGFISFRHNEGRLSGASDSDGDRWEIAYNADGLISDITKTWSSGGQCVTRYTYLTGEITGLVPVPSLPAGKMFDMAGQTQMRYEILTTSLFM